MIDIDVSKIISEIGEPKARLIQNEDEKKQKKYIKIFSFAFLIIFILATGIFFFLSKNEGALADSLTTKIDSIKLANTELAQVENEAIFIQQRNKSLLKIIQGNPNWSYVFETLEDVVPKNITFARFEVESPQVMRIAGNSPDYETLSKLVVSMSDFKTQEGDIQKNVFGSVNVTNASLIKVADKTMVEFTVSFSFVKKINKEAVNPLVEVSPTVNQPANQGVNTIPVPTPTPTPTPTPAPSENSGLPVL